ncbi:hypothetical protein D3C71_1598600 [compost metagenome]
MLAGQQEHRGHRPAHGTQQALGAAGAGHDAHRQLRLAEARRRVRHDEVAHHGQLAARTECETGDRCNGWLAALRHRRPVLAQVNAGHLLRPLVDKQVQVGAGREHGAAGDDDGADRVVVVQRHDRLGNRAAHGNVERVALLRPVQHDDADGAVALDPHALRSRRDGGARHAFTPGIAMKSAARLFLKAS